MCAVPAVGTWVWLQMSRHLSYPDIVWEKQLNEMARGPPKHENWNRCGHLNIFSINELPLKFVNSLRKGIFAGVLVRVRKVRVHKKHLLHSRGDFTRLRDESILDFTFNKVFE